MEPLNDDKKDNDNEDDIDFGGVLWLPSDQGGSYGPLVASCILIEIMISYTNPPMNMEYLTDPV